MDLDLYKYEGFNLGGVLLENYEEIRKIAHTCNCIMLRVANEYWYGSYYVPQAAGFSTPVSICKGGTLSICNGIGLIKNLEPILEKLRDWNSIYQGQVISKDNVSSFTEDKISCVICTEDYNKGDKLMTLGCGHQFHLDCVSKWKINKLSNMDVFIKKFIYEERLRVNCPICSKITS